MSFDENSLYHISSKVQGERYSLFDLATWKNGLPFKKIDFSTTGKPVIKIAELNHGITDSTAYTEKEYSHDVFLTEGDLVFSWSGNPLTSIDAFRYELPNGWLNQHIFKITANESIISKDYLYYVLKHLKPNFIQIATNKQTTGLGHVTIGDIKRLNLTIPSRSYQENVVALLKPIDDKIATNRKLNDNLAA